MAHPPPKLLSYGTEKVLLVDWFQPTCDARSKALRAHGIDVRTTETLDEARVFFQADRYDLVLLDLHRYPPAEVLVFCRLIKSIDPSQRIALLVGPPSYLTLNWQKELAGLGDPSQPKGKDKRHAAAA